MRALFSIALLSSLAAPAFARDLPEPSSIALMGIAAVGVLLAFRKRK